MREKAPQKAPPTARQVYALAATLCERLGEGWPETRAAASELIERLRAESGHPAPQLEQTPPRRRRHAPRRPDRLAGMVAARLVREMR